jgi:SOS response regulatory protein OraA/RecX
MWRRAKLPSRLFHKIDASTVQVNCEELMRYLDFVGMRYLSRYQCSSAQFHRYLQTKAFKVANSSTGPHKRKEVQVESLNEEENELVKEKIQDIVQTAVKEGVINDEKLAARRIQAWKESGKSVRFIQQALRAKGLQDHASTEDLETNELDAALLLCKRRNIRDAGPKSLGILARAGFSYSVSKEALNQHLSGKDNSSD